MSAHVEWLTPTVEVVPEGTECGEHSTDRTAVIIGGCDYAVIECHPCDLAGDILDGYLALEGAPMDQGPDPADRARVILAAYARILGDDTTDLDALARDLRSDLDALTKD